MSTSLLRRAAVSALVALIALPAAPALASYTISCESRGYRYQYCGANTQGYVRLLQQTSSSPCIRGRSWGSDGGGVWVNNGCSGQFEVGGNSGGNSGSNAGAAVAAAAGLAILGAIIANHERSDDNYEPPGYYSGGAVPGWAVGTFRGTLWGQGQTIQISPDGAVNVWYNRGGRADGWFSGSTITINNNAMNVQPSGGGILVNGSYFGR